MEGRAVRKGRPLCLVLFSRCEVARLAFVRLLRRDLFHPGEEERRDGVERVVGHEC